MALGRSTSSVRRAACACPSASNTAGDFDGCNLHDDAGDEPGINPANESAHTRYGRIHEKCQIQVTDYSWDHYDTRSFENEDFVQFLSDQKVAFPRESDETPTVRWINVGGVSWDVLSALTMKYDIHSLALEDILRPQDRNSSKCDYFKKCLFVRIVCHTLRPGNNSQERETLEDGSMGSRSDPHIRALTHRWRRWTQHSSSEEALPTSKSSRLRFPGLPSSHSRRLTTAAAHYRKASRQCCAGSASTRFSLPYQGRRHRHIDIPCFRHEAHKTNRQTSAGSFQWLEDVLRRVPADSKPP